MTVLLPPRGRLVPVVVRGKNKIAGVAAHPHRPPFRAARRSAYVDHRLHRLLQLAAHGTRLALPACLEHPHVLHHGSVLVGPPQGPPCASKLAVRRLLQSPRTPVPPQHTACPPPHS